MSLLKTAEELVNNYLEPGTYILVEAEYGLEGTPTNGSAIVHAMSGNAKKFLEETLPAFQKLNPTSILLLLPIRVWDGNDQTLSWGWALLLEEAGQGMGTTYLGRKDAEEKITWEEFTPLREELRSGPLDGMLGRKYSELN